MNWLDILLAAILLLSFAGAFRNGISREIIRIAALVAGIAGGMWWYPDLAAYLAPYVKDPSLASFTAFITIVVGSLIVGGVGAWLLAKILHWSGLRWFDRLLGGAFGLVRGMLAATALVLGVVAFSPTMNSSETVATSRIAPWVLHGARMTAAFAPESLRTTFFEGFDRVRGTWSERDGEAIVRNQEDSSRLARESVSPLRR
jgi:membrane protein required for colicin V production